MSHGHHPLKFDEGRLMQVLKTPVISEKSTLIAKNGSVVTFKVLQDATKYEVIIQANPSVPITPILESGIKLKIPVLDANNEITFELPPWRR